MKLLKFFFLPILIFVIVYFFLTSVYLFPDGQGYFSYLSSMVFDGDLHFYNDFLAVRMPIPIAITKTDYVSNIWTFGPAFFWMPFYLLGKFFAELKGVMEFLTPYSGWFWTFVNFGTMFYSILTFLLLVDTLKILMFQEQGLNRKRKNFKIYFYSILAFVSTPMFFYSFIIPCTAHGISAFTVTLFLWYWLKTYKNPRLNRYILLGLFAGLMVASRTQESIFIVFVLIEFFHSLIHKPTNYKLLLKQILAFGISFIFSFSPQMFIWKIIYGSFLAAPQKFNIALEYFSLFEVLFSSYHGILFWTPIFFVALLGLFFDIKKYPVLYISSIIGFIGQILINSFCVAFWEGYSFGLRQMTSSLFVCCLGLATFGEKIKTNLWRYFAKIILIICSLWTFSLCVASTLGLDLLYYLSPKEIFQAQVSFLSNLSRFIVNLFTRTHPQMSIMILVTFVGWVGISISKKLKLQIENNKPRNLIVLLCIYILVIDYFIIRSHFNKPIVKYTIKTVTHEDLEKFFINQVEEIRKDYLIKKAQK